MKDYKKLVTDLCKYEDEEEWFEFKENWYEPIKLGKYISGLSNSAALLHEKHAYFIWGVNDETHDIVGTDFSFQQKYKNEPLKSFYAHSLNPDIDFNFYEIFIEKKRIVVLEIDAASEFPTSFEYGRYIRIGGALHNLKDYPRKEAQLFACLSLPKETIENTKSKYQDLSFKKLFAYYGANEIELNKRTFEQNLNLKTEDDEYNLLAQLLSDNSHMPLRVSIFDGETKADKLFSVREFGNNCILYSLQSLLEYGDVLNLIQTDESNRLMERKEVPLFENKAFREAIINAVLHNDWKSGNSPMVSVFRNRIEILSHGTLPLGQTQKGFFEGISIPVNQELSDIFLQLHISERSGRGVPKIVETYGKEAYEFLDNAIRVTIPFNRINLFGESTKPKRNKSRKIKEELNENSKMIRSEMRDNPKVTTNQLMNILRLKKSTIEYNIRLLQEKGYIKRIGSKKKGSWEVLR